MTQYNEENDISKQRGKDVEDISKHFVYRLYDILLIDDMINQHCSEKQLSPAFLEKDDTYESLMSKLLCTTEESTFAFCFAFFLPFFGRSSYYSISFLNSIITLPFLVNVTSFESMFKDRTFAIRAF